MTSDPANPATNSIDMGELRRLSPLSDTWGVDRGGPLDRYYIHNFLERQRPDIRGRVLEIKDNNYTHRFGAGVTRAEALDIDDANSQATIIADLTRPETVPEDAFDCFIFTQTLHIIYDIQSAVASTRRLLKPGGVVLCTVPAVSRVNYEDGGLESGDFWRFTAACVRRLFGDVFGADHVTVEGYGNVLACTAFLYGLAPRELTRQELDYVDPWFPLIFCIRAVKPSGQS